MEDRRARNVKLLTHRIAEFIEAFNIEGCNLLLEQRLELLADIQNEVAANPKDEALAAEFHDLLIWLEQQDAQPQDKVVELKAKYQLKLSKQKKANVAIKQYTSL
ncbi:hypothetical protein DXX93_05270 [Thalassotalea euphylliae]|uniref:Uncharacterized protein n=1 Tax=Thalassotalea euphylliae TaxID=1655234 RepID=A0A3E0TNG3_9GAMM|nr:hypothetical protein [Thalassotalea euphylliae]REL26038.1 hypothetical protein DXX93_05270 [Thalassotalea euphylliae]